MKINLNKYISIIRSIANKLSLDALWHEDICNWIDYTVEQKKVIKKSLGSDFYNGTSGLAMFLLKKETLLPDPVHNKTRQGAVRHILNTIDIDDNGLAYYHSNLGKYLALLSNAEFDNYEMIVENISKSINNLTQNRLLQSSNFNEIDGMCGAIDPLLHFRSKVNTPAIEEVLDEILTMALKEISKKDFVDIALKNRPIGFGQSIMGSLPRLLKLANSLDNQSAKELITKTIKTENRKTKPVWKNWRTNSLIQDLLNHAHPQYLGWENGWAGMAQARLETMKVDDQFKGEAIEALDFLMTLSEGIIQREHWASNYSMAHGLAGIGRIMIDAFKTTGEIRFLRQAQFIGDSGYDRFYTIDLHWPSGILAPNGHPYISTYGMMNGISGTGMFYLELLEVLRSH